MSDSKPFRPAGTDWTRLLTDPELVRHLGKLLQTYRDARPENREEALLAAMREIKGQVPGKDASANAKVNPAETPPRAVSMPSAATPPFEPDMFGPNWGQDRRRHFRLKCFVAVELRVDDLRVLREQKGGDGNANRASDVADQTEECSSIDPKFDWKGGEGNDRERSEYEAKAEALDQRSRDHR